MSCIRLLLHKGICQTRAVALDEHDRPVQFFFATDFESSLRLGDVQPGIVAKSSPSDGGCFVKLERGQEGFLAHRSASEMTEGRRYLFRVAAEARMGKLARVVLSSEDEKRQTSADPIERWRAGLPGDVSTRIESTPTTARDVDAVFEDALNPISGLENGGRLQIMPTPALLAIDVDTVGRRDKGRASARAKLINQDAARTAARQIALRNLGGNIVIDCVGPLARADGASIKAAFVTSFREASRRKVSCLPPSPLGMMEAIVEHGARPLHDALYDAAGDLRPWAELLSLLRRLEIEATARPADQLKLSCPSQAYAAYLAHRKIVDAALLARFGGRTMITDSQTQNPGITTQ